MEINKSITILLGIFLITQFLGLFVGSRYIAQIQVGQAAPVFNNPERPENSFLLIFYILIATGILIFVIKFRAVLIRVVEALAILVTSMITFNFLFPIDFPFVSFGFILAVVLTAWKILRPSIVSQNIALIISVAGAGAVLGASLGIIPVLIFIVLLSIYDFVAVFVTKHMVYIAKEIVKRPTAFTAAIPTKFKKSVQFVTGDKKIRKKIHVFHLGGGDIAIPLMFAVSVLGKFTLLHALLTTVGSAIMLFTLFSFVLGRPGRPLPALPWISIGTILGFLVSVAIF